MRNEKEPFDQDTVSSYILKTGVMTSIALILIGMALLFIKDGGMGYTLSEISSYNVKFHINSAILNLSTLPSGLYHLDGIYFISLGLWVLVFTPVSVVVTAIVAFVWVRNKLYIVLSAIVLFNLVFAIFVLHLLINIKPP